MKNKIITLTALSLFASTTLFAKEVLDKDIDKSKAKITLGIFKGSENATQIVKRFYKEYDIYTGFYKDSYYQYIVNILPSEQNDVMQEVKKVVPDAYFVRKNSFDYGVKLLETKNTAAVEKPQEPQEPEKEPETIEKPEEKQSIESLEQEIPKGYVKVDLIDAVLQTLSRSYRVKAAQQKVVQAKRNLDIAKADFKPTVDFSYSVSQNARQPGDLANDGKYEDKKSFKEERLTLSLDQNIYAGGKSTAYLQKMQKEYQLAKNSYIGLIESEISKTIRAYFDIVFRRDALAINEENISQLQEILEIVKIKYESGALSIGELSSVEASISNAMSQLSRTKSRYNNALEFYNFITGRDFEQTYPYQKDIDISIEDFETLQEMALKNNNRIKGFVYQIASKKDALSIAEAAFKPKLDLQLFAQRTFDEEDFEVIENEYTAKLNFSYNLYNGGRDKAAYLKAFSSIQESNYEKEAEILELIWNLEKLHTSLTSLQESLRSIKDEVSSSVSMVDSYWEGFRYGEQDLYILLQAQRQLNSAQLQFVDSSQDSIIDYFKILELSGQLIEHFDIDIDNPNFLDMSKGSYHTKVAASKAQKDRSLPFSIESEKKEQPLESKMNDENTTQENEPIIQSDSLKELLSYQEKFLMHQKEDFTVAFKGFEDIYEALAFIDEKDIEKEAFVYKTLSDAKVKLNVAYNRYSKRQDAQQGLENPKFNDYKEKEIVKIKQIQEDFEAFNTLLLIDKAQQKTKIVEKLIKPEPFKTDKTFKEEFLSADENFYTINVTTFKSLDDAAKIVQNYGLEKQSFVFSYGANKELYKFMYGVYETYEQAQNALDNLGLLKENFLPVIEKISKKQTLYKRYNR